MLFIFFYSQAALAGLTVLGFAMFLLLRVVYYDKAITGKVVTASCAPDKCDVRMQYTVDNVTTYQTDIVTSGADQQYVSGDSISLRASSVNQMDMMLDSFMYHPLVVGASLLFGSVVTIVSLVLLYTAYNTYVGAQTSNTS